MKRVAELLRLDGRAALVTGGAGHLGLAIGEALAEAGASVVVADRLEEQAQARAQHLARAFGVPAFSVGHDLAAPTSASALVTRAMDRFGRLDVLVNNAAFVNPDRLPGWTGPLTNQSLETWDASLRVNLTAPFLLAQAAHEALAASGRGAIVNIGSIYGSVGPDLRLYAGTEMGNAAAYGASKGGLSQLTRHLATVFAPRVRVNCVSPGGIERGQPESFRRAYEARTPLGRMAREEDLKGAVLFLASDAAAYVTGIELLVDGGWTAW